VQKTLTGHTNAVSSCAWPPDGQRIFSASNDGTIKAWDSQTGSEIAMFLDPSTGSIAAIDVMGENGYKIVAGASSGRLLILQLVGLEFKSPSSASLSPSF